MNENDIDRMACKGAATIPNGDFEECQVCQMSVRHDLTEHHFFGFASSCSDVAKRAQEQ